MGVFFNPLEFIYAVNCWGLVKRMGFAFHKKRAPAALMGIDFKSARINLRCALSVPREKEGACIGRENGFSIPQNSFTM